MHNHSVHVEELANRRGGSHGRRSGRNSQCVRSADYETADQAGRVPDGGLCSRTDSKAGGSVHARLSVREQPLQGVGASVKDGFDL